MLPLKCLQEDTENEKLAFFAFGDWGQKNELSAACAKAMNDWALRHQRPAFILALGDNFYPNGVCGVEDKQFKDNWQDGFLLYETLRVRWNIILGNHDYATAGSARAQIAYTDSPLNSSGLWHLPNTYYSFIHELPGGGKVHLCGIDTNGACPSWYTPKKHVEGLPGTKEARIWLDQELTTSDATWKIVFGHHPVISSRPNKKSARLASPLGSNVDGDCSEAISGFGLTDLFAEKGVDAYFCGHEHVFSCHALGSVNHFMCGAVSEMVPEEWLDARGERIPFDWFDYSMSHGFVAVLMNRREMEVTYYDTNGREMHKVILSSKENCTQVK